MFTIARNGYSVISENFKLCFMKKLYNFTLRTYPNAYDFPSDFCERVDVGDLQIRFFLKRFCRSLRHETSARTLPKCNLL